MTLLRCVLCFRLLAFPANGAVGDIGQHGGGAAVHGAVETFQAKVRLHARVRMGNCSARLLHILVKT